MIAIHYFASIRESLGREHDQFELPGEVDTVEQLIAFLVGKNGGDWSDVLESGHVLVAVNHEMADRSATVSAGDEIAFFPPVTGG